MGKFIDWDLTSKTNVRQGAILPFVFLIIGIVTLFPVEYDTSRMIIRNGTVAKYTQKKDESIFIFIAGDTTKYYINYYYDKVKIKDRLKIGDSITIWMPHHQNYIAQIEINGNLIFEYHWYDGKWISFFFILIGLIFIPFSIVAFVKNTDDMLSDYK